MTYRIESPKINSYVCIFKGVLVVCIIRIELVQPSNQLSSVPNAPIYSTVSKPLLNSASLNEAAVNTGYLHPAYN